MLHFKIGPVRIAVGVNPLEVPDIWSNRYYRIFETGEEVPPDLMIRVHRDSPPPYGDAILVGELENQWRLYTKRGGWRMDFLDQIHFQPAQVVLMNSAMSQAEMYVTSQPANPLEKRLVPIYLMVPFVQWWLTAWLASRAKGLILHGAAVSWEGQGMAFIGPSGSGKTTVARWCRDEAEAQVLSDERIVVWREENRWWVSGTPWPGELHVASPCVVPLARFFLLNKAEVNQFVPLPPETLVPRLIPEAYFPFWGQQEMSGLLEAAERLVGEVPAGELRCVNGPGIVSYLKELVCPLPT